MKQLLAVIVMLFAAYTSAWGQMIEDPATWTYEAKKKSANEYELVFHLSLKEGWHIWSLHPGGDGYQVPPGFSFDRVSNVTLKGNVTEKGKATTTVMDGIEGKVTFFSKKVDYIQLVQVAGKAVIKGKNSYQVCNDRMCLPPKSKEFVFNIK